MHRSPEPPPRGGSSSFDKSAWRPTDGRTGYSPGTRRGACAGRKAGSRFMLEPPLGGGSGEPHPRASAQSGLRPLCAVSSRASLASTEQRLAVADGRGSGPSRAPPAGFRRCPPHRAPSRAVRPGRGAASGGAARRARSATRVQRHQDRPGFGAIPWPGPGAACTRFSGKQGFAAWRGPCGRRPRAAGAGALSGRRPRPGPSA